MLSTYKTNSNLVKTGLILLFVVMLSISGSAGWLRSGSAQPESQVALAQTGTATTLYLPITVNTYYDPYYLRSPFSIEIAALHEILPTTAKTTAADAMGEAELQTWYEAAFPTLLEALKASGATNTRIEIKWSYIEPNPPDASGVPAYDWSGYDSRIQTISESGIQIMGTIMPSNDWAATPACGVLNTDRVDEFSRFVTDLVNHYKVAPYNIKYWEVINEPDYTWTDGAMKGVGCWGLYGAEYADLLQVASAAIHSLTHGPPLSRVVWLTTPLSQMAGHLTAISWMTSWQPAGQASSMP